MIAIPAEAYPLSWPTGVPRRSWPAKAPFGPGHTIGDRLDKVRRELKLLQPSASVISTNLPLRLDGKPMASASIPRGGDHGVAVYWVTSEKRGDVWVKVPHAMPCDKWDRIEHNLHAIALSIEALRGVERWGAVTLEQAFAGFAALPPGDPSAPAASERPWREVLDVPADGWVSGAPPSVVLAYAKTKHRELIKVHHPDRGGDPVIAAAINRALELAEAELGG